MVWSMVPSSVNITGTSPYSLKTLMTQGIMTTNCAFWATEGRHKKSPEMSQVFQCVFLYDGEMRKANFRVIPLTIQAHTYRFGQGTDQQLPNRRIHTVPLGPHTDTGQQAEVISLQATCHLNPPDGRQICFWCWHTNNSWEVCRVYWGPVPFWRVVMIKIGKVLGWRTHRSKAWHII